MAADNGRLARSRTFARWHRRLAAVVGAWLLLLALTGTAINRAHDWGLDRSELNPGLTRLFYGPASEAGDRCGAAGDPLGDCLQDPARLALPRGELMLTPGEVVLVDADGAVVERLPIASLGLARLEAAALSGDTIYLGGGEAVIRADLDLVEAVPIDVADPALPPPDAWVALPDHPDAITWERALQDIHAARFLGPLAAPFSDLMAVLLGILVLTGAWLWWLRRRS